jgi:hypothetical protein
MASKKNGLLTGVLLIGGGFALYEILKPKITTSLTVAPVQTPSNSPDAAASAAAGGTIVAPFLEAGTSLITKLLGGSSSDPTEIPVTPFQPIDDVPTVTSSPTILAPSTVPTIQPVDVSMLPDLTDTGDVIDPGLDPGDISDFGSLGAIGVDLKKYLLNSNNAAVQITDGNSSAIIVKGKYAAGQGTPISFSKLNKILKQVK